MDEEDSKDEEGSSDDEKSIVEANKRGKENNCGTEEKDVNENQENVRKTALQKAKEKNKEEAEAAFLKFHKVRRTFKSDGKEAEPTYSSESKVRPPRFECNMCAKYFITEDELKNHIKMAKTIRWVCSASGRVAAKRKAPSDDLNDIALPRKKLRQMKQKRKKTKKPKSGQ